MHEFFEHLPEAANAYLGGRRLDEVECVVADLSGIARGKAMPANKFANQKEFFLPNSIFLQTITGDWADPEGEQVCEHVPGIAEERNAAGEQPTHDFHGHPHKGDAHGDGQPA